MIKIMPIYGTRPEAIKMAPIIQELKRSALFDCVVTVTGQHRAMLDQVNELFGISPSHDLNIMRERQSLTSIMARTLVGLEEVFAEDRPDVVIVQGDTTTSTAAALVAFYHKIPVVHAEAGLRSGDMHSPFPEEANRKLTSQISSLHLAPTAISRQNLLREGVASDKIVVTGNTVIDALMHVVEKDVSFLDERLQFLVDSGRKLLLVTTHRRENIGDGMKNIGLAVAKIANTHPDLMVIFPLHLNPAVREVILPFLMDHNNIYVTQPLSYGEFTKVLGASTIVLSDSGGVQEEAPSLGKPVLVMRTNTERPEAVVAGTVRLVGTDSALIVHEVNMLLCDADHYSRMARAVNPYGDGLAAARSLAAIGHMLGFGERLPDFDVSDVVLGASTKAAK
ncbi:non-hydrolyzing UDP-N-acetylglucosamine 2-epimerase [Cryobacterium sp. Y29]|uniref:non-hydrolyzing UDP-N-acetylglucosamine 2-epimerase n=1 Tax=Cryobacterium sp. Y29 TaxID=2048285 RepID=UPI000CE46E0F|nr:UDP-N-acetylglucosamine 2-epimerase (non-hydrolyzing) [Cryobacterium sp. Y29]